MLQVKDKATVFYVTLHQVNFFRLAVGKKKMAW